VASILAVPTLGWPELLLILAVLLLLFGARKLPEMARSLGRSTKEFKSGMKEGATEEPEAGEVSEKTDKTAAS
jgi:sec-independent protein translocase protein TatA